MRRSFGSRTRFARSHNVALAALLAMAACAPARTTAPGDDLPRREPAVAVGLHVDTAEVQLGATSEYELVSGGGAVLRRVPATETTVVRADAQGSLRARVAGEEIDAGSSLVARPSGMGMVAINGRPYRGSALVRASGPGRLTAINQVDMESYLLGVVPHEIGRVGPELLEAAKAQAVAARTYAFRYLGRRASLGFDVFATVEDQVYGGAGAEHEPVSRAVRETAGEILTYAGEPIEAFYHSTCAGQTAAIEEVWPTERPRPYLVSVVDVDPATGVAFDSTSNRFRWTQRWTAEEIHDILNRTLADSLPAGASDIGELQDFEVLALTPSQRIERLRITTSNGSFDVGGDRIRWIFLTPSGSILNSSRFDLRIERDAAGGVTGVVAEGMGWGHGIGMCQVGAMGRARAGQNYRTILQTYYPGTAITPLY